MSPETLTKKSESVLPAWRVSWVDQVHAALARAPVPWWVLILVVPVILIGAEVIALLITGSGLPNDPAAYGLMIFYATQPTYLIALIYFLDRRAERAIIRLQPQLRSGTDPQTLRLTIGNMPYWPVLLWTAVGLILFLLAHFFTDISENLVLAGSPDPLRSFRFVEGVLVWMAGLVAFYHTVRQLRIIDHTFTRHVKANLLDQVPLYGLASVSAYTAIGLAVPSSVVLLALPQVPTDAIALALLISVFGLPVLTFIAPLYRVHMELVSEKASRLSANAARIDTLIKRLHHQIETDAFEQVGEIHTSIEILHSERALVGAARTWPWPAGSIRALFATLFLPILIWIIQRLLESLFP